MKKPLYALLAIACAAALLLLTVGGAGSRPWAALLAIGAVGGILALALVQQRRGPSDAYRQLLGKAHGDAELVERLIAYERARLPEADRRTLAQRALDRWERDLR